MAQTAIPTTPVTVNTPPTYRLAGSCSVRAFVACDDTPYHLETPVVRTSPDTDHSPEHAAKVRALFRASTPVQRRMGASFMAELIDANPSATVAQLLNLINQ